MSFFDALARWLGLSEAPAPAGDHAQGATAWPASGVGAAPAPATLGTQSPYSAMWASVDRHLAEFMHRSVLPHRHFAPDDVFQLVRIQVAGQTPQAQQAIDRFLDEFRPESRRQVALAAVARNCPQGVSTEAFVDFHRDFEPAALEASDPYDAQLAEAQRGDYEVTLYGEWTLQPATAAAGTSASPRTAQGAAGPALHLDIHDAAGQRSHEVTTLPLVLGRSAGALPAISGTFVSRRHGMLERDDGGRVWWRDTSVNGSQIDGSPISPGERRQLRNGARLQLGGAAATPADCPTLVVHWEGDPGEDTHTPLRAALAPDAAPATPLRTGLQAASTPLTARAARPLGLLAIHDAQGARTIAITALPHAIGRGEAAHTRVPEANAGVSREHLRIVAFDSHGAHVENLGGAKWGTSAEGQEQPERFVLRWGQQAVLAPRFIKAPPVTVLLLEPNQ